MARALSRAVIRVVYYYSACIRIETPELSVLCDPWFTEGAYDGSWYHYPPVEDALRMIPASDFVYVSHIHPDHYDPIFLRAYLEAHPKCRVIVARREPNYLSARMRADGIDHCALDRLQLGHTVLSIVPNSTSSYDVDSALVVRRDDHSVVNMNDNLFHREQVATILEATGGPPHIALLGYTGAGPYPQTYYDDVEQLRKRADAKKRAFFDRYLELRRALDPRVAVPFAGKYLLGGKLHGLNAYRGVADACEVLALDDRAVVLADAGRGAIDTSSLSPTAVRTEPYDHEAMTRYAASLADRPMAYETYFGGAPLAALPIKRLLPRAFANALKRSLVARDYYFCIKIGREWFAANIHRERGGCSFVPEVHALRPRSEIDIDPRYLFGLLTGVFHWNNAEIGSQYRTTRVPDSYDRDTQAFLSFCHV